MAGPACPRAQGLLAAIARCHDGLVLTAIAAAAWLVAAPASAPAGSSRVVVHAEGCEGLRPDEVGRVLDLELAMVTTEIRSGPPLEVGLRCAGERLTITVLDPLTRKRLERDVPAPAPEPGLYTARLNYIHAGDWHVSLQFRRDSTARLEKPADDLVPTVFAERPISPRPSGAASTP